MLALAAAMLWWGPVLAQSNAQLGPLCTSEGTPADKQIDACNKILALKVFSGEKLATIYFWRAVGWNKKGDYAKVIADTTEALRLRPDQALYNMRGSAYFDKGEYDIAIADFNDGLRMGRRAASSFTTAPTPGAPRVSTQRPSPITTRRSGSTRREPIPIKTGAPRSKRSAISTARSPISTRPSGSIPLCPRP